MQLVDFAGFGTGGLVGVSSIGNLRVRLFGFRGFGGFGVLGFWGLKGFGVLEF